MSLLQQLQQQPLFGDKGAMLAITETYAGDSLKFYVNGVSSSFGSQEIEFFSKCRVEFTSSNAGRFPSMFIKCGPFIDGNLQTLVNNICTYPSGPASASMEWTFVPTNLRKIFFGVPQPDNPNTYTVRVSNVNAAGGGCVS